MNVVTIKSDTGAEITIDLTLEEARAIVNGMLCVNPQACQLRNELKYLVEGECVGSTQDHSATIPNNKPDNNCN